MKSAKQAMTLVVATTLVGAGGLALGGQTQAIPDAQDVSRHQLEQIQVKNYHYGMQLDMARVLSISDTSQVCGVVPSVVHYEDSKGELRAVEYLISGGGCSDN